MALPQLSAEYWAVLGLIAALAVLWSLRAWAGRIESGIGRHDRELEAAGQHQRYAAGRSRPRIVEEAEGRATGPRDSARDRANPATERRADSRKAA